MRGRRSSSTCCSVCCAISTAKSHVTYVRNITDVDDKINARALRDFGAEIDAETVAERGDPRGSPKRPTTSIQKDVAALGCLPPTHRAARHRVRAAARDGKADMIG